MDPRNDGAALERAIFGGSDSELSDDDLDIQKAPPILPKERPQPQDDYASSAGASDADDYVQQKRVVKKKPTRKAAAEKPARKRKRKPTPEPIDISQLPPDEAAKRVVDMRLESIFPTKKSKPRKRKAGEEVLDTVADEQVGRLRDEMLNAVDQDIMSNANGLPATAKLKLLPTVMETLRKFALAQSMIDNNLFEAVTRWLEPLRHDRSLPSLNIQREFFPILKRMDFIDTAVLKESGLGKIVMFYTKCKRVTPDISRIARELMDTWSRPIIKRSASFRDRDIPTVQTDMYEGIRQEGFSAIMARGKAADKDRIRKNAVAIPRSELKSYTVAPNMSAGLRSNATVDADVTRRRRNAEKIRSLTRKVTNK